MKSRIIAVGTASAPYLSIAVRASEPRIKHNLLQALAILPPEIPDKGIIPFTFRETIFFKLMAHRTQN